MHAGALQATLYLLLICLAGSVSAQGIDSIAKQGFRKYFKQQMKELDSLTAISHVPIGPPVYFESDITKKMLQLKELRDQFYPYGDITHALKTREMEISNMNSAARNLGCNNPQWRSAGPKGDPQGTMQNRNGRLDCIAFNPHNSDIVYVGSGDGGSLWKINGITGAGTSLNSDHLINHTGVCAIAAIPLSPTASRIIIATGHNHVTPGWAQWSKSCNGIYYTDNEGAGWTRANVYNKNNHDPFGYGDGNYNWVTKLSAHPTNANILFMTVMGVGVIVPPYDEKNFGALYKSTDGGQNWYEVNDPALGNRYFQDIEFHPINPNIIYLSSQNLYKSTDGGNTWTDITTNLAGLPAKPANNDYWPWYRIWVTVPAKGCAAADGDHVAVLALYDYDHVNCAPGNWITFQTTYFLYHSTDALSSSTGNTINLAHRNRPWWITPQHYGLTMTHDPDVLYIAGRIFQRSDNGGADLTFNGYGAGIHADNHEIGVPPYNGTNAGVVYVCTDGGLFRSNNYGATFTALNNDLVATQFHGMGVSQTDNTLIGGAQDNYNMRKRNDGTWYAWATGDGGKSCDINAFDADLLAFHDPQVFNVEYNMRNSSGAVTLSSIHFTIDGHHVFQYNPYTPNQFLAAYDRMHIATPGGVTVGNTFKSSLSAQDQASWEAGNTANCFAVSPSHPHIIYLGTRGQHINNKISFALFKSVDGGVNWQNIPIHISSNVTGSISSIAIHPTDPQQLWITWSGYADENGNNQNVFYTTDGGAAWHYFNPGLPKGLTKKIVYRHGSNDELYLAMEHAIYRWNTSTSTWECYDTDFPSTKITDMEISYCSNKLYVSTYGRGVWESDLPVINSLDHMEEINVNTQWNINKTIYKGIRVKTGKTLTIRHPSGSPLTVHMPKNGRIIVEPGAKLILDNVKITNNCDNCMWRGIEVWGSNSAVQLPAYQGVLEMKNGSVIEHALTGIANWNQTDHISNSTGGIIAASNSSIINCRTGVHLNAYTSPPTPSSILKKYQASFNQCTFLIDNNFKDNATGANMHFNSHVQLDLVSGPRFNGCKFLNRNTAQTENNRTGNGIRSSFSGFVAAAYCPLGCQTPQRSEFKGFTNGIWIEGGSASLNDALIDRADFDSCSIGIRVLNQNNVSAYRNTFKIGRGHKTNLNAYSCVKNVGIFNTGTEQFNIEDNEFTGFTHSWQEAGWENLGAVVEESRPNNNQVYHNNFTNLKYACMAVGNNSKITYTAQIDKGLRFRCNIFSGNTYDISAWGDQFTGIALYQGAANGGYPLTNATSAGNTFQTSGATHIRNEGHYFTYLYDNGTNKMPVNITPASNNGVAVILASKAHSCISRFDVTDGPLREPVKQGIEALGQTVTNLTEDLNSLIDGGSTDDLVALIEDPSVDIYEEMLSRSPYVSGIVLRALADADILSKPMLMDVILANPRALNDPSFIQHLQENIPGPLEDDDIQYLMENKEFSDWEAKESDIAAVNAERSWYFDWLITDMKRDTVDVEIDSITRWLGKMNETWADYESAGIYYSVGALDAAEAVLGAIPDKYTFTTEEENEYGVFMEIWGVLRGAADDNRSLAELNESEHEALLEIEANTSGHATGKQIIYVKTIRELPMNQVRKACAPPGVVSGGKEAPRTSATGNRQKQLKVYPNPANDYVVFEHNVAAPAGRLMLTVTNAAGQMVTRFELKNASGKSRWDTRQVPAGIYIYKLSDGKKQADVGKVVIVK